MYIYKTTNVINGKVYIGQSIKEPSESKRYLGSGKLLSFAIKKYGKESFLKEILEETSDFEYLQFLEEKYIALYNSRDKSIGYNLAKGGSGSKGVEPWNKGKKFGPRTEETRAKIKKAKEFCSDEERELRRQRQLGKKWPEEHKKKLSEAHKGQIAWNKGLRKKYKKVCPTCNNEFESYYEDQKFCKRKCIRWKNKE
jgi:group I intron endonuclease